MATPPRFYCPQLPHPRLSDRHCALDADQTRHARKVLRLRPGDAVELFSGDGLVGRAAIEAYDRGRAICAVSAVETVEAAKPFITVAAAIPKGSRADQMVNLLGQVGCDRLIPLVTERSEVDPREGKLERFERSAMTAARQSGRPLVMRIDQAAQPMSAVLRERADVQLIATIGDFHLPDLHAKLGAARSVLVLVGPVGDWTEDEIACARQAGFFAWTIGPYVLRVEAAAATAAAILRYLAMGGG